MWGAVAHAHAAMMGMAAPMQYSPSVADALQYMSASGDWSAAAGYLQSCLYDGGAVLHLTQALEVLPAPLAAQAGMAGGVDAVLLVLRTHGHNPVLQAAGCRALATLLAATSPYGAPHAMQLGGMDLLLAALRTFPAIADNVEAALHALSVLTQGAAPASQTAATVAGAISDVLVAMRAHEASPGVARTACTALAYVISEQKASQAVAGAAGAVGAVLRALRAHPEAEEAAAWALANLIDGFPANLKRFLDLGAAATATELLASASPAVAAQAARILALLAASARVVTPGSCAEALVRAMATHAFDNGVQVYCCAALCALGHDAEGLRAARQAGAARAVDQAVRLLPAAFDVDQHRRCAQLLAWLHEAQRAEDEAARHEEAAEPDEPLPPIQFGTVGPLAQPLPLPDDDAADVAVKFGTFGDADEAAEPRVASPNTMVEHLDLMMPWLRLDASSTASPAAPAPASPAAAPQSPPKKGLPAPLPLPPAAAAAPLPAAPAPPAAAPQSPLKKAVPAPLAAAAKPPAAAPQPLPVPKPPFSAAPNARTAADEERELCVVCLHERICVALLPCRHLPVCASAECATMLGQPPLCPICRIPVAERVVIAPPPRAAKPPGVNAWAKPLPGAPLPPPRPACAGGCGSAPTTLFLPCRHLALCGEARCAAAAGAKGAQCPACRAEATAAIPLFMP